jgi:hypothetical protein
LATNVNHRPGERLALDCPDCGERMQWQFPHPHLQTDTSLRVGDGFTNDSLRRQAHRQARAAGIYPFGKVFMPGLADDRGYQDPAAWIDRHDFRGGVKRVCANRGLGCEGTVNVKKPAADFDALPPYSPDPTMVAEDVEAENQAYHGGQMTPAQKQDRQEALTEQYAGN